MVRALQAAGLLERRIARARAPLLSWSSGSAGLSEYSPAPPPAPGVYAPPYGRTPAWPRSRHYLPLVDPSFGQWFRTPPSNNAARYAGIRRREAVGLPRGAPPTEVAVQPVWASRLVNMRDFLRTLFAELAAPGTNEFSFVVPRGYSAILAGFRYVLDPMPLINLIDAQVTLLVDGRIVTDFKSMPFGEGMSTYEKTWVMAGQNSTVTLRLVLSVALPVGTEAIVYLYGHMRLTDGRPLQYEVGEKVKPTVVTQAPPPAPLAPPAPPPGPPPCPPGALWRDEQGRCVMPATVRGAR